MMTFIKRLFHDRRGATAVALAIMAVPLMITAGAAVDLSRAASARALLQASTDAAAIAGAGAWQSSESYQYAASVTTAAYTGTASQLPKFITISTPTPDLTCTGSTTQCGGKAGSGTYVTTTSTYGCPSSAEYCVVVKATGVLKNSLLSFLIPSELLSARSMATTAFPAQIISGKNIPPSPGFGSAGDVSGIYAYAVPMSGPGANATPDYTSLPTPNSACNNYAAIGPLAQLAKSSSTAAACNYLFIALSTSSGTAGAGGSIALQQNQPIGFNFVNYSGANGYHSGNYYQTSTNLEVYTNGSTTPTYHQNSTAITTSETTTYTYNYYACMQDQLDESGNCPQTQANFLGTNTSASGTDRTTTQNYPYNNTTIYVTTVVTSTTVRNTATLTGACPDHTLYGSLDSISVNTTTGQNNVGIPVADSLNVYSSAYEVAGYPPTYETNHALIPFISPMANSYTDINGNSYVVHAVCPNYDRSNTSISAPISNPYAAATGWTGLNIYSTAFPGQSYSDSAVNTAQDTTGTYSASSIWMTNDANDIYPPGIAGCTPATPTQDPAALTSSSTNPWWNWNKSNSGNCANESSTNQSAYLASGQPQYSNCALLIQPLGTAPPVNSKNQALLPDYYILIEDSSGKILAMDPVWDGQTFTDLIPGVITSQLGGSDANITVNGTSVTDTDLAAVYNSSGILQSYGYTPNYSSSYTITSGTYANDTAVVEPPAYSSHNDFNPPQDTSHQCYNPQKNGNTATQISIQNGTSQPTLFNSIGGQNNGTPVDAVANPQLGAILCNSDPPETYALYWNDLGTYGSDDLGYWNAVVAFTCSVPGTSTSGGGPATLSG